jgi:thioredoxin-related protein
MKWIGWFFIAFLFTATHGLFAQMSQADSLFEVHRVKFDPARNPTSDVQAAVITATKEKKRIILDVGGEWCSWCHLLDRFLHEQADLDTYLSQHYVIVKVNFSTENKNKQFLRQYPTIDGFPHLFVLESDGKFLLSQSTGNFEAGKGYDHDKVMRFLKKWSL